MLSIINDHDSLVLSHKEIGEPVEPYRDNAQIYVGASSSGFRGDNTVWIARQELQTFCQNLIALKRAGIGTASLSSISPRLLSVTIRSVDPLGTIVVEGSIAKDVVRRTSQFREGVHFGFELDFGEFIHSLDGQSNVFIQHFALPASSNVPSPLLDPDLGTAVTYPTWLHHVLKRPGMYFQTGSNEFLAFAAFAAGVTLSTSVGLSERQRREFAEIYSSRFRSFVFRHFHVSRGYTLGWDHVIHNKFPNGAEALQKFKELWSDYRNKHPAQDQ